MRRGGRRRLKGMLKPLQVGCRVRREQFSVHRMVVEDGSLQCVHKVEDGVVRSRKLIPKCKPELS
jgi:hypothetical protein